MRRLILGIAIASVVAFAPVVVQADDSAIASHIEQKLREANQDGRLKNFGLDMQVSEGIVWFKGYVSSPEQERLILTTAQKAKDLGVVKIIDEISIQAVEDQAPVVEQAAASEPVSVMDGAASEESVGSGSQLVAAQTAGSSALSNEEAAELAYYRQQAAAQANMLQATNYTGDQVVLPPQRMASLPRAANQFPLAAAPAGNLAAVQEAISSGNFQPQANLQAPAYTPVSSRRANAQYDHPSMPNYAWPSYAAHPNYGAVSYPQQYSPSAWPYIGPFYPYPQVPLGWRKVTMEWDDGWWFLDFQDH